MDGFYFAVFLTCAMPTMLAEVFVLGWALFELYYKSYRLGWVGLLVIGGWIALTACLLVPWFLKHPNRMLSPGDDLQVYLAFLVGSCLAAGAIMLLSVKLPARVHRTGPTRRRWPEWRVTRVFERCVPWLGGGLLVSGVAGLWMFPHKNIAVSLIRNGLLALGVLEGFRRIRKIEAAPSASELLTLDERAPVLYIRAFQAEHECFTYGGSGAMEKYVAADGRVKSTLFMILTMEQYLGPCIEEQIGPVIGLGNPRDYLRTPGVARDYRPDENWQELFLRYAERAKAIVMRPTVSDNLRWEVEQIVRYGWQERLQVIVRPLPKSRGRLSARFVRGVGWMQHIRPIPWRDFTKWLADAGLEMQAEEPGPGTVITFDAARRSVRLIEGADEPQQFVAPMADWLSRPGELGATG